MRERLRQINPGVKNCFAEYVHLLDCESALSTQQHDRARELLDYGPTLDLPSRPEQTGKPEWLTSDKYNCYLMDHTLILIISGIAGAVGTFFLQKYGCSAVVASCLVGLLGALVGHLLKSPDIPLVVFAGSFVGMTSLALGSTPLMIIAGIVAAVIYKLTEKHFVGFGGKLGTIAFVSVMGSYYVIALLRKWIGGTVK